jgi:hypothetical protein
MQDKIYQIQKNNKFYLYFLILLGFTNGVFLFTKKNIHLDE